MLSFKKVVLAVGLLSLLFLAGCFHHNGKEYRKGAVLSYGRFNDSGDADYRNFSITPWWYKEQPLPDIEVEYVSGEFVGLKNITSSFLEANGRVVEGESRDETLYLFSGAYRFELPEDINIYRFKYYEVLHSKENGILSIRLTAYAKGARIRANDKEYTFPLSTGELIEIFGKPDKLYNTRVSTY